MLNKKNIFFKKRILIYGLGKSGLSAYKFLKDHNQVYLYDDKKVNNKSIEIKKKTISYEKIVQNFFDHIIISPGVDIKNCPLSIFLKKNKSKINTDLDVFFNQYSNNKIITITGTNGKSTTVQVLYNVLKEEKKDVRLVGNIGKAILAEKNITNKSIFVVEASSYQLEYSKIFRTNVAVILNISSDHLERHGTLKNYINAKFKLIKNQTKKDYAILNTDNLHIKKYIKNQKFLSKIIKVNKKDNSRNFKKIENPYFLTEGNKENLLFIFAIVKILKIKEKNIFKVLKNFNGLKFRQQIIFKSKNLTIINDSKATSFSSSVSILKSMSKQNVSWIIGGLPKKGDKLLLSKHNCKSFKAYIFGKNKNFYEKKLNKVINYESFSNLKSLVKKIFLDIKNKKNRNHQIILFSPASASFDTFKNFEERGIYFNNLIKKIKNVNK
jgi:UDP-N-acetylmuramoylalanine--D-glutamate ligase